MDTRWIDGLKGISAMIVLFSHIIITIHGLEGNRLINETPFLRDFFNGNFAVWIFVILSSYLAAYCIEKHRDDILSYYKQMAIKRYLRIGVPVALVVILMFLQQALNLSYADDYGFKANNTWLCHQQIDLHYLPQAIFMIPVGQVWPILNIGWMLGYVLQGYFVIIILDLMCRGHKAIFISCVCTFIMLLFWWSDFHWISVVYGYLLFNMSLIRHTKPISLFLFVFFLSLFLYSEFRSGEFWSMIRATALVSLIDGGGRFLKNSLGAKPLVWLGKISFSIYLLQLLVIYSYTCGILYYYPEVNTTFLFVTTVLLTILISFLYEKLIQKQTDRVVQEILHLVSSK